MNYWFIGVLIFCIAALACFAVWRWKRRKTIPLIDPYPGGDTLREYVKSEYEHKPSHEGDQPKSE